MNSGVSASGSVQLGEVGRSMRPAGLYPGRVLVSRSNDVRVLVLSGASQGHRLDADGLPLVPGAPTPCSLPGNRTACRGLVAGAIYRDNVSGIEVRCLVGGEGTLTVDGRPMRRCRHHKGGHSLAQDGTGTFV